MKLKTVSPYVNFDGNAEEAFTFYSSVFGVELSTVVRFQDFDGMMGVSDEDRDKLAHVALPLGNGSMLMGSDTLESFGNPLVVGNNYYVSLELERADEAEQLFDALSAGGEIIMPLEQTEWAEKFGMCIDKFGVQWMVSYTGSVQFGDG